jgi:predicted ribosome quality control (RQC) complex YloA/Tae2 family protein
MSKTRFSSTDVKAAVRDLRNKVLGLRLANIYDMDDNKTYILKFSSSGSGPSNENKKLFLLLESGVRFHTTKFSRDKNELPAPFTMKLRRFIRLKRLEDIRQIGFDRVVDLKFGSGEGAYHIILELYAQGNIILTDCNYEIISLLRSHQFEGDVSVKVNEIYPLSYTTSMTTLAENRKLDEGTGQVISDTDVNAFLALCQRIESENLLDESASSKKKTTTIKQALLSKSSVYASFGPEIIDHCLSKTGIPSSTKLAKVLILSRDVVHGLLLELSSAETILASVDKVQEGYILYKESEPQSSSSESTTMREYVEFVPYLFDQHLSKPHETYVDFDEAVDNYFLKIEEQKLKKHAVAAEENAKKKVLKVTSEQQQLIEGLSKAQTDLEEQASLVEMYAEDVDKVCLVLNSGMYICSMSGSIKCKLRSCGGCVAAMASGMSWDDIAEMVEQETKKGGAL